MRKALALAAVLLGMQAQTVGNGSISTVTSNQSAAINGNSYLGGTTPAVSIGIGSAENIVIANSAGSGKYCLVYEWHTSSTASIGAGYMTFMYNPTTNLPATSIAVANQLIGSANTSVCSMKAAAGTAMTGGVVATSEGLPQALQGETFIIMPGQSLGIITPSTGIAINATESFYWRDVPLGGF